MVTISVFSNLKQVRDRVRTRGGLRCLQVAFHRSAAPMSLPKYNYHVVDIRMCIRSLAFTNLPAAITLSMNEYFANFDSLTAGP